MKVGRHIFDTPEDKHPLRYEEPSTGDLNKEKKWITSADLEYMTLIMIYALVRLAWEGNVLIIGLIKDTVHWKAMPNTAQKVDLVIDVHVQLKRPTLFQPEVHVSQRVVDHI